MNASTTKTRAVDSNGPELLTLSEVAALFRVHERTVMRWRDAGRITPRHVGRKLLFARHEVAALAGDPDPDPASEPTYRDLIAALERIEAHLEWLSTPDGLRSQLAAIGVDDGLTFDTLDER